MATATGAQGQESHAARFLALGDVNLGRHVGQELLKGDTLFPFRNLKPLLDRADLVFANLESQITEQHGETQSPKSNLIFCAPPVAGSSLKEAGIGIVSAANNHAWDYGKTALRETSAYLDSVHVAVAGIDPEGIGKFRLPVLERGGIRFGFAAYAEFVNLKDNWQGYISLFDSARARVEIATLRSKSDIVVVSYHGGNEYSNGASQAALGSMRFLADAGADIVLGHHPHVVQGMERRGKSFIFFSLGNVVFYQPQRSWTQLTLAPWIEFHKDSVGTSIRFVRLLPIKAGYQPSVSIDSLANEKLFSRFMALSPVGMSATKNMLNVQPIR
ncbi:MAG: CapA family protein [Ignavibacteriales bacterium]|nr:CapA family protein [Ignavibacteriales bacterium]